MADSYRSNLIKRLDDDRIYEREVLAVILSNAYGGRDMSGIADALMARFPSVRSLFEADLDELVAVEGVSRRVALYLKTLGMAINFGNDKNLSITDGEQFVRLVKSRLRRRDNEYAEFFLTDKKGRVTDVKTFTSGDANSVRMATDEVIKLIAADRPYAIYVAHNHVNCPPMPSPADDRLTAKIAVAADICGVKLIDHLIINSDGEIFSYARSGRLEELKKQN